ncbi:hypothetical protein [Anaerobacillus alkalidiazotrophicus]|uniref:hypothetical protein n=1 Tax=Anaerobacillus alkalidiazotrophicus TaxID=472963 RepID=UPI001471949B|nr:hypothetical protein [Anaerobacillus alkalidiazotrophicus]
MNYIFLNELSGTSVVSRVYKLSGVVVKIPILDELTIEVDETKNYTQIPERLSASFW